MNPIIFEEYNFHKAEIQFPLINTMSSDQEIEDTAWAYAHDLLNRESVTLADAIVGEYYGTLKEMEAYHRKVLLAVVEKDYVKVGKLVEDAMGEFVDRAVDYIEEHIEQMRYRYE